MRRFSYFLYNVSMRSKWQAICLPNTNVPCCKYFLGIGAKQVPNIGSIHTVKIYVHKFHKNNGWLISQFLSKCIYIAFKYTKFTKNVVSHRTIVMYSMTQMFMGIHPGHCSWPQIWTLQIEIATNISVYFIVHHLHQHCPARVFVMRNSHSVTNPCLGGRS